MKKNILLGLASLAILFTWNHQVSAAEYDDVVQAMDDLMADHPGLVQDFSLGQNNQGQEIWGLQISHPEHAWQNEKRVEQLVVGTHHGNEQLSAWAAMEFAVQLVDELENYDGLASNPLVHYVYYIVPVLNVGGFNAGLREEADSTGTYHDPNRDYPDPCAPAKKSFQLASTGLLKEFIVQRPLISGAITIHGFIGTFTYPWGIFTDQPKSLDDDTFRSVTEAAVQHNGYLTGTHTDVIYPATGAFEDWAYHKHGIWVSLLELDHQANLEADARALLTYFSLIPTQRSEKHAHLGSCTQPFTQPLNHLGGASQENASRP